MRIPTDPAVRALFYENVMTACMVTRAARRTMYRELKRYYLHGCGPEGDPGQTVNKIYPHLDQLASFMYSQDTTKFAVIIGPSVSDGELARVPTLNDAVNDMWHSTNSDVIFGSSLTWAFVYGSMFIKKRWNGREVETYSIEPHNMGVLREDVPMLDRQEAFVHCFLKSKTEVERELRLTKNPHIDRVMQSISGTSSPDPMQVAQAGNIIVSQVTPNIVGNVDINLSSSFDYTPKVHADLVKMYELYIWNDATSQYQIVTIADPNVVVYDRPLHQLFIPDEQPITQICPSPAQDYFWGYSEVERLIPLQDMRNDRLRDVRKMMSRQADPPKNYSGYPGISDEMNQAFDTRGGYVQTDLPGAKVEPYSPPIPDDLFADLKEIDAMFEEMSGINNILSGRGEQGVRSQGHAADLARLGASRAKKRALIIEDGLERCATLDLKIERVYSEKKYKDRDGISFVLAQFTDDFKVKVDTHSNSPIFTEDTKELAFKLFEVKAIDRAELLDMISAPMKQLLKQTLREKIEPAEAKAAEEDKKLRLLTGGGKK